jgi:hypothetical protein
MRFMFVRNGRGGMSQLKVLQGWKEIASYLNRGVRTVQRWEAMFGLPVHRPAGHSYSAVLAIDEEIDHWLSTTTLLHESGWEIRNHEHLQAEIVRLQKECGRLRAQFESTPYGFDLR